MTAAELDALAAVMAARKLQAVKFGDVELVMSPAAFLAPPADLMTGIQRAPEPEADPRISAPWAAFSKQPTESAPRYDPTDPNAPIDDRALFGADMPQQ